MTLSSQQYRFKPRSGDIYLAQRVRACCPTRSVRVCKDLPRPLPGSTVVAVSFRWRRAEGACHRLIFGTHSACSLCGRVVVIPIKPALGNRPVSAGIARPISIEAEPRSGDIVVRGDGEESSRYRTRRIRHDERVQLPTCQR